MHNELESKLKELEPVKQIQGINVYTLGQMIEFSKVAVKVSAEISEQEMDEQMWESEGVGLVCGINVSELFYELFEEPYFKQDEKNLTLAEFLGWEELND